MTTHVIIVSLSGHFKPRASIAARELSTRRDRALAPCPRLWGEKIRNSGGILTFYFFFKSEALSGPAGGGEREGAAAVLTKGQN